MSKEPEKFYYRKKFLITSLIVIIAVASIPVYYLTWYDFCQKQYDYATKMYQAYHSGDYQAETSDGVVDVKMTIKDVQDVWSEYNDSGCNEYKQLQFIFGERITLDDLR